MSHKKSKNKKDNTSSLQNTNNNPTATSTVQNKSDDCKKCEDKK